MALTGHHRIAGRSAAAQPRKFRAHNATTNELLTPEFAEATSTEVDECLKLADAAFNALQAAPVEQIASLLDEIAAGLEAAGAPLLERAHAETALPLARLESERGRTVNQTKMFARMNREGSWVQARIDHGDPERQPLPKPDVRTMLHGIGTIAVFGASNFPLAISVAGTDTVSALAARCPVVVKGHPGHPGTCELIADVVVAAVEKVGMPAGVFSLLQGAGNDVGLALVKHPLTAAVAFTARFAAGGRYSTRQPRASDLSPSTPRWAASSPCSFCRPDSPITQSRSHRPSSNRSRWEWGSSAQTRASSSRNRGGV